MKPLSKILTTCLIIGSSFLPLKDLKAQDKKNSLELGMGGYWESYCYQKKEPDYGKLYLFANEINILKKDSLSCRRTKFSFKYGLEKKDSLKLKHLQGDLIIQFLLKKFGNKNYYPYLGAGPAYVLVIEKENKKYNLNFLGFNIDFGVESPLSENLKIFAEINGTISGAPERKSKQPFGNIKCGVGIRYKF